MEIKKKLLLALMVLGTLGVRAQSYAGISIGTSNNDQHMETVWFQQQLTDRFSIGTQLRYSQIRYRFVDAIAINDGSTSFAGLVLGFKLKETETYRLDFNMTGSYRYLSNDERPELPESTNGLEIDPNIIFGLKLTDRLQMSTGAMLRTAMQFGETAIPDEQLPSAIILAGLSYRIMNHSIQLRAYTGPMNGASGDSMKYFNQVSIGYQYTFGDISSRIQFFNF